jgi:hypothetical protein
MRRPRAFAGLVTLMPATLLLACSDLPAPTESPRAAIPTSVLASQAKHVGAIVAHDSCDPETFDAVIGDGTCVKPGRTTFQEFIGELAATQTARSWRFNPLDATARRGEDMLAVNVGGEEHTFTPVRQFGGGFIPDLNQLSGNPVPAPECLNVPALDFVEGGEKSLISGAALAAVAGPNGVARVLCCIHPWMRAEVQLK